LEHILLLSIRWCNHILLHLIRKIINILSLLRGWVKYNLLQSVRWLTSFSYC
jgi:hypothetical protein